MGDVTLAHARRTGMAAALVAVMAGATMLSGAAPASAAPDPCTGWQVETLSFSSDDAIFGGTVRVCTRPGLGGSSTDIRVVNSGPGLWVIDTAAPWPAGFNLKDPADVQVFRAAASRAGGRTVEPGQDVTVTGDPTAFAMHQDFALWAQWQVTRRLVDGAQKKFGNLIAERPVLNALVTCGRLGWGAGKQIAELPDQDPAEVLDGFATRISEGTECTSAVKVADAAVHPPRPTGPLATAESMAARAASERSLRQTESKWGRVLRIGLQSVGKLHPRIP